MAENNTPSKSSLGRFGDSSTPLSTQQTRVALAEAGKAALAAQRVSKAKIQQARKISPEVKLVVSGLIALVFVGLAVYFAVSALGGPSASAEVREAMKRLKSPAPKASADMELVKDKFLGMRTWAEIEGLLGEPDLKVKDHIALFESKSGTFDFAGDSSDLRAYYVKDPDNLAANPKAPIVPIYLFVVYPDGKASFVGPRAYSRVKLPPSPVVVRVKSPDGGPQAGPSPASRPNPGFKSKRIRPPIPQDGPNDLPGGTPASGPAVPAPPSQP